MTRDCMVAPICPNCESRETKLRFDPDEHLGLIQCSECDTDIMAVAVLANKSITTVMDPKAGPLPESVKYDLNKADMLPPKLQPEGEPGDAVTDGGQVEKSYVVFDLEDGGEDIHGGPYAPMKAREVRDAMAKHIENGRAGEVWDIPENAEDVKLVPESEWSASRLVTDGGDRVQELLDELDDDGVALRRPRSVEIAEDADTHRYVRKGGVNNGTQRYRTAILHPSKGYAWGVNGWTGGLWGEDRVREWIKEDPESVEVVDDSECGHLAWQPEGDRSVTEAHGGGGS